MLDFLKEKKNLIIIIIIIALGIGYFILNRFTKEETVTDFNMLEVSENTEEEINKEGELVIVHITGAVNKPGIVKLKEGSRIEDAIEAAGGLTEDSDISNVNLAYILDDGIKIRIPTIDDEQNKNEESYISQDSGQGVILDNESLFSLGSIVNINKANQTELETLPGIGPSLAARIIDYRESKGKFSKIEDIKNVTGIGDSKYNSIKDLIKVK